jgi:hypothetical protein
LQTHLVHELTDFVDPGRLELDDLDEPCHSILLLRVMNVGAQHPLL